MVFGATVLILLKRRRQLVEVVLWLEGEMAELLVPSEEIEDERAQTWCQV